MFRDDDHARATYLAALERKAARVDELEDRIRELEVENAALRAGLPQEPAPAPPSLGIDFDFGSGEIFVDAKLVDYVAMLVRATEPGRTEGILSGARTSDADAILAGARESAHAARRRYANPDDVKRAALAILPARIVMTDPDGDPHNIVRAILSVVEVP